jgi:hypothetical protein
MRSSGRVPGAHLGAQSLSRLGVDREGEVLEGAGQDDAVVAACRLDRDVLVEHVVEHLLGGTRERVAPAAPAAVVVLVALARLVGDTLREVADLERLLAADACHQLVRRAVVTAGDAGHGVLLADDVGIDGRRHEDLLPVEAAAAAAELARTTRVGLVVASELAHREDRLVDLGGCADQVAEAHVHRAPAVLAADRAAVRREGVDGVIDEGLPGPRMLPEDHGRHAHLVDLRTAALRHDQS